MAASADRRATRPLHPFHAFLLAAAFPLFLGGLLSDLAYSCSYQMQWSNFAAWLIAGAMILTGLPLLWALFALLRAKPRRGRPLILFLLLAAIFLLGLINSFVHARDAYATMPDGLVLSAITVLLALVATWIGFSGLGAANPSPRPGDAT